MLFYPLYLFIKSKKYNILIIIYLYMIVACIWGESFLNIRYMYQNCIGHIPEFCLGIYAGVYGKSWEWLHNKKIRRILTVLALVLLVLAQLSKYFWYMSGAVVVVATLCMYSLIQGKTDARIIGYIGTISPVIYIIHGVTLRGFFVEVAKNDAPLWQLGWCLVWLVLVICLATLINKLLLKINYLK